MNTRRMFLKSSALAMFGAGTAPAWLSRAMYGAPEGGNRKKVLIAIFQRGAVDGLNMVVPFGEKRYYELRPSIAIPAPGNGDNAAVDLDGFFGLHPSLAPLKPMWDAKTLAIVEAAGSPDPTRSHFDAQDYMESGTPGVKATQDGWLNRALPKDPGAAAAARSPVRAVSLGTSLARTLRGANESVAISNLKDFKVRDDMGAASFEQMYASSMDRVLRGTGKETFEAVKIVKGIESRVYQPANGAKYPESRFGQSMLQIARLVKADAGLEVAFADIGGWDTHVNEVPQLGNLLRDFGNTLGAFHRDMGDRMSDVVVVTMSEFGRTAKENGNRGTDHGHANAMMVFGGEVKGGKVYGEWPGLGREQLYERRDLAVTTDFRDVLSELVSKQLGNGKTSQVFPGYRGGPALGLL